MKQYNRTLDYTVLALAEMKKGKPILAARLFAKAAEQSDVTAAIAILEASNAHAYKMTAASKKPVISSKQRLTASDEFPFDGSDVEADEMDMDSDPLDEVEDSELEASDDMDDMDEEEVEEDPSVAMAKVLSRMTRAVKK